MTSEQVKNLFRQRGITFTRWAEEHGYSRNEVYRVLNGQTKARYGKAHDHILQKWKCDMSKVNISSSGTRILRVLKALRGHALNGVSNGELASALGESPANINRALNTLIEEGLAMKLENGRFAPGIQLLQIAMAHSHEMARAQDRINEINQRVISGSRL